MKIKDFDIWYSYSSYFIDSLKNIDLLAKNLIENKICDIIYFSNDKILYSNNGVIINKKIDIEQNKYDSIGKITLPDGLGDYQLEGVYQSSSMKIAENSLFTDVFSYNNSYIRGFVSEFSIKCNNSILNLYPQLKIYNNGIIILTFRMIAGDRVLDIEDFLNNRINLHSAIFEDIFIPKEISKLIVFILMGKKNKNKKIIEKWTEKIKIDSDNEDFNFEKCSIKEILKLLDYEPILNFDFIKTIIFDNIIFSCIKDNDFGNYWLGRPTIYLLDYENQPNKSDEIIKIFDKEIASILSRGTLESIKNHKKLLQKDMRDFNDYSYFASKASSLFIYSKEGIKGNRVFSDLNRGHLIYDKQIIEEAMLYYFLSYKKEEEIVNRINNYPSIIKQKRYIKDFEFGIEDISYYGEIDEILLNFQNIFKIRKIKDNIDASLKLKEEETKEKRNINSKIISDVLYFFTLLFGAGTFCNNFVIPLYNFLITRKIIETKSIYYFKDIDLKNLILYSITVLALWVVTFFIKKIIEIRK